MVWRKGREKKKKNNNTREVEGFETTLSCYVESYLNKFVPCSELTWNFQTYEKQNKEKRMQKKNNHTHKTVFTRFSNLLTFTELQGFHLSGKKNKVRQYSFFFFFLSLSLSRKNYIKKTLITKTTIFISCTQDSQWATKRAKFFFTAWANRPKPLLHGLSLKKSPIKNHATSFRVGLSSGSNSTKLHKAQHSSQSFSWCYSF